MALFEGFRPVEGSRSNTALIKSGHTAPAEHWLLDQRFDKPEFSSVWRNGVLLNYQYGGPGMEDVVIPKGRVLGVSTPVKDFKTKKFITVITLPGLAVGNNSIGMVPYNLTKDYEQQDRFGGNQPSVVTDQYVTLPYMPGFQPKTMDVKGMIEEEKEISIDNKMPWGAVIGKLEVGDYVKATASGRLTKWIKGTDGAELIAGQALASDLNYETWGWLKWVQWDEAAMKEDDKFINRGGVSGLPSDAGYPFDPRFAEGNTIEEFNSYHHMGMTSPTGIPGLHDGTGNYSGFGKNDTVYENMELGEVPEDTEDNSKLMVQALDFAGGKCLNLQDGVTVKIGDTVVAADKYKVNYNKGIITLTVNAADAKKKITATYKANHYGTSSYLDFKGVQGLFNILLKY